MTMMKKLLAAAVAVAISGAAFAQDTNTAANPTAPAATTEVKAPAAATLGATEAKAPAKTIKKAHEEKVTVKHVTRLFNAAKKLETSKKQAKFEKVVTHLNNDCTANADVCAKVEGVDAFLAKDNVKAAIAKAAAKPEAKKVVKATEVKAPVTTGAEAATTEAPKAAE